MNKTAIKNFAVWARVQLMEAVSQKAFEYGITAEKYTADIQTTVAGKPLSEKEKSQLNELVRQIESKGFEQVMEEVAYTWFNRFIALRFMEVNGYLPSRIRVFSNENGEFKPEILKEALNIEIDEINREYILDLLDKQDNETLYKYLIITQCNALNSGLPGMFEKISNYTELLFPSGLLKADSVISKMVTEIDEADWEEQVQIIGWLYQYYNSELKDNTFAKLKKNIKITKERIPAATQLFTPDWIVRYMVENSLGRLWYEGHNNYDKSNWKYYLDEAEQTDEVKAELEKVRAEYKNIDPKEIKFIDPCMGSGHILVYAFDVFMEIYLSCGYSERDAAVSILQHNLYGLDIDKRAYQLSLFALMMKARQYNRRILNGEVQPNLMHFQDISEAQTEFLPETIKAFAEQFKYADTYGSLLEIHAPDGLDEAISEFEGVIGFEMSTLEQMMQLYKILGQKYDVVVTNPPYMGSSGMNTVLSDFVKKNYPDSKSDLFAVFIERCAELAKENGYYAMITQHAWMFLSSYEKLRQKVATKTIVNMAHLGARAFDEIGGEVVQTTAFVNLNNRVFANKGTYVRMIDVVGEEEKRTLYLSGENRYIAMQENFSKIPGSPVAYWVSVNFVRAFENPKIGDIAYSKQGVATADNNRYLRVWYEVAYSNIKFNATSHEDAKRSSEKWYPYNKGGNFRKWYGNNDFVVNWENDGFELRHDKKAILRNPNFYFKESVSWSLISSSVAAFRYKPCGHIFDVAGMSVFSDNDLYYLLALCNTKFSMEVLKVIAPTINYQCGDIANIPVINDAEKKPVVDSIVEENIAISKEDWDDFETSWDFEKHPLI